MLKRYLGSIAVVAIATLAARLFGLVLGVTDIVMVYLAAAVFVAARFGRGPAVLFSFLSCACYNFFFVEPLYTFEMYNRSSWLTLLVMLVTSMVISGQAISLREQEKLARESALEAENERIRNLLLSSVSHDLRTPLAAITGASSGLMSDAVSLPRETVRELAGSIHREATRLSHLVSNLLDITKLEAGTVTPNCQPYFIDELVGAALSHTPGLSSHRLETRIEKDLPLVFADGLMIEQVLINLLDNAAKYAPAGTTVTVAAARSGDHVVVRIEDEGPGIPVGDERKVFGKFFRGSRAVGSGLGLAICDGIIRAHHENIWAENRPQGGRASLSHCLLRSVSPRMASMADVRKIPVLVIEDEPEIRKFLAATLASNGFEPAFAANAREGLVLLKARVPEILILDLGLPDADGLDVIRDLRGWSGLPIIVLSARGQEADKIAALELGADDYLTKPFGIGELLARLRASLRRAQRTVTKDDVVFEANGLRFTAETRQVFVDGREVHLTPTEYRLLALLVRHAGRVVTHKQLLQEVWGKNAAENSHYLRIYTQHLRHKLGDDPLRPRFILTEPGVGYQLKN